MMSSMLLDRGLWLIAAGLSIVALASCSGTEALRRGASDPLLGKVICVDPGHGGTAATDAFRVGPTGEREEWINLRVALLLRELLENRGAIVVMTRTEDVPVELADRAQLAKERQVHAFVSIHHNATADSQVNHPIVYFHGNASENLASVALGQIVARRLRNALFDESSSAWVVSDHVIFPGSGASVLRNSYGIPGVIGEASFFSNPDEEQRLKTPSRNRLEADAYLGALEEFFSDQVFPVEPKDSQIQLPPFPVFEQAERMNEEARSWQSFYLKGLETQESREESALQEALDLFTRSVQIFPDSDVARTCHLHRASILRMLDRADEAAVAEQRASEHYVSVD